MPDEKPTQPGRKPSKGIRKYVNIAAILDASLLPGAKQPKVAGSNQPQQKISQPIPKTGDQLRAPPVTPGQEQPSGLEQIRPEMLPMPPEETVQPTVEDDKRRQNVHDALRHRQRPEPKKMPVSGRGAELTGTAGRSAGGETTAAKAAGSKGRQIAAQAIKKVAQQVAQKIAVAALPYIGPIILIVGGVILAAGLATMIIVYIYCLYPPSPCGKAGSIMTDFNNIFNSAGIQTSLGRSGINSSPIVPGTGQWAWPLPVKGKVTCEYGCIGKSHKSPHSGMDIAVPSGTPIKAVDNGVVIESSYDPNLWGQHVIINHGNGLTSLYGHMIQGSQKVTVGQQIKKGDIIGSVGETGKATGPHLHLTAKKNGATINPRTLL